MADADKNFDINIRTQATGTGAKQTLADLEAIKRKAVEVTATAATTAKMSIDDVGKAVGPAAAGAAGAARGMVAGWVGAITGFVAGTATSLLTDWLTKTARGFDNLEEKAQKFKASFADLGRTGGEARTPEQRSKDEKAANDELKKAIDEVTQAYERQRKMKDELLDAVSGVEMAEIDAQEAGRMITPDEARNRRAGVRLGDARRRIETQREAVLGPLGEAQGRDRAARQAAQDSGTALDIARRDFGAALERMREIDPAFKFTPGENLRSRAIGARGGLDERLTQMQVQYGQAGLSNEEIRARQERARQEVENLERLAGADEVLAVSRQKNARAQAAVDPAADALDAAHTTADPQLRILRLKSQALDRQQAGEEMARQQKANEEWAERMKENPSLYIPPSPPAYRRPAPSGPGRIIDETGDRTPEIEKAMQQKGVLSAAIQELVAEMAQATQIARLGAERIKNNRA